MIVKQKYAGWIGVIAGNEVHNASIEFDLTPDREDQLIPYKPTAAEIQHLDRCIRKAKPYGHEPYTSQLGGQYVGGN